MSEQAPRLPSYRLALLLACLVPGLGQLVLGRTRRGVVLLSIGLLSGPTLLALALAPPSTTTLVALLLTGALAVLAVLVGVVDVLIRSPHDGLPEPWSPRAMTVGFVCLFVFGLVAGLGAMAWVRAHALEAFVVPSSSMAPTIQPGDRVLVEKSLPFDRPLRRGDIVVYRAPGEPAGRSFIKRIVGLPGDRVGEDRQLVPPASCWVEGDSRDNSKDSRTHGAVPLDALVGRVVYRFWPLSRLGVLFDAELPASGEGGEDGR